MISDLLLAQACSDIYSGAGAWDYTAETDGVAYGLRSFGDDLALVFRGSCTPEDWLRDFCALAIFVKGLGWVDLGFYKGIPATVRDVLPKVIGRPLWIAGHSLGGAHAWLAGADLYVAGVTSQAIVCFEPPKPGLADFRDMIDLTGIALRAYRNAADPVPDVPMFPYEHPVEPTLFALGALPSPADPLARHHIALDIQYLTSTPTAAPT